MWDLIAESSVHAIYSTVSVALQDIFSALHRLLEFSLNIQTPLQTENTLYSALYSEQEVILDTASL